MEGDPGFVLSWQHFAWNSSDWSKPNMWLNLGNPNYCVPPSNTTHAMIHRDCLLPLCGFPDLYHPRDHPRMDQSGEHLGWLSGLPRYRQAFAPSMRNIPVKDGLSADPSGIRVNPSKPNNVDASSDLQKFFVFDQSGNRALIFGLETNRIHISHMATPKQLGITDIGYEGRGGEIASKGWDENKDADVHSEMHEDTEELNALLYSDEESDYSCAGDEDEVTSTGHSPSTMTGHWGDGFGPSKKSEEAASSPWPPSKKRKLPPSAGSSAAENPTGNFDSDDAISSSGDRENISKNRAIKRARISETISVLQNLVPDVKGKKDPMVILDEAIKYLNSLKLKAAALGLNQI